MKTENLLCGANKMIFHIATKKKDQKARKVDTGLYTLCGLFAYDVLCVQEVVTHFIQLAYYIKWVTTSWTYCISNKTYSRALTLIKGNA